MDNNAMIALAVDSYPHDYLIDQSRAHAVYTAAIVMFISSVATVSVRLYVRTYLNKYRGADDYWIMAAMMSSVADFIIKLLWLQNGLGRHAWNLSLDETERTLKLMYAIQIVYPITLGCAKISILTLYLRLFPDAKFRVICHCLRILVAMTTVTICLSMMFACTPISFGWQPELHGHCIDKAYIQYTAAALNLLTDLGTLMLPIKYLCELSVDMRKKIACLILFSFGFVTCIASGVRASVIAEFFSAQDPPWVCAKMCICSAIEANLAIITSSIPACRQIFHLLPEKLEIRKYFSRSGSTDDSYLVEAMKEKERNSSTATTTNEQGRNPSTVTSVKEWYDVQDPFGDNMRLSVEHELV